MPSFKLRSILPVALALVLWEVVARAGIVDPVLFPPPSRVLAALVAMTANGELWRDIQASYLRVFVGLFSGAIFGVAVGLITGRVRAISDALTPLIQIFRPLPPVAIIPLIIVWLGIGEVAKFFSIAFAVFFPMWLNTHVGTRQIPQKLLWCASTLTRSRRTLFLRVLLPATLPFIAAGFRLAISVAFVMVFVSELAGASRGIGYAIQAANLAYRIDRMMADLFVLGASGALADIVFSMLLNRTCPWLSLSQSK